MKSVYTLPASSCCAVTGVAGSSLQRATPWACCSPSSPEEKPRICLLQLQMQLNYSAKPMLGTTVRGELSKHDTHGSGRVVFRAGDGEARVRFCVSVALPLLRPPQ